MTTSERARFPWGLTGVVAVVLTILIGLGVWQVRRLAWKEGLIAQAEAAATQPPTLLMSLADADGPMEFRQVLVDCPGLATAPFVELRTIQDGEVGMRLVSACAVPALGRTWLVDRGFVSETISARPPQTLDTTPLRIVAVVRTAPSTGPMTPAPERGRYFFGRDTPAMARALGASGPVAPETLYAVTSSNPEWAALKPSAPPVAFSNNHLGYALTWFGLALALVAVYAAMVRRKLKS